MAPGITQLVSSAMACRYDLPRPDQGSTERQRCYTQLQVATAMQVLAARSITVQDSTGKRHELKMSDGSVPWLADMTCGDWRSREH